MAMGGRVMTDSPAIVTEADFMERLAETIRAAYHQGAEDVHESWVSGNGQDEADFGEAASDYLHSIDLIWFAAHAQAARVEGAAAEREAIASFVEGYPSPMNDLPMALAIRDLAAAIRARRDVA
jgi:hypothetical protein